MSLDETIHGGDKFYLFVSPTQLEEVKELYECGYIEVVPYSNGGLQIEDK